MSTIDPVRRPGLDGLLRALIEEARQRARRRRRAYGAVVFSIAVVGALLLAALRGPSGSESSPAALAGPATPVARVAPAQHVYHGLFRCIAKRGKFSVAVGFPSSGRRFWDIVGPAQFGGGEIPTGQYASMRGRGRHVEAGGHASAWHARLVGFVNHGRQPRQRVVITLRGRPSGTCAFIPTQAGALERDSGTQSSGWRG